MWDDWGGKVLGVEALLSRSFLLWRHPLGARLAMGEPRWSCVLFSLGGSRESCPWHGCAVGEWCSGALCARGPGICCTGHIDWQVDVERDATTLGNGYLGSRYDEERSEMRYLV